jgi:hypothetical protein
MRESGRHLAAGGRRPLLVLALIATTSENFHLNAVLVCKSQNKYIFVKCCVSKEIGVAIKVRGKQVRHTHT